MENVITMDQARAWVQKALLARSALRLSKELDIDRLTVKRIAEGYTPKHDILLRSIVQLYDRGYSEEDIDAYHLADLIKVAREKYSVKELSNILGFAPTTIYSWPEVDPNSRRHKAMLVTLLSGEKVE